MWNYHANVAAAVVVRVIMKAQIVLIILDKRKIFNKLVQLLENKEEKPLALALNVFAENRKLKLRGKTPMMQLFLLLIKAVITKLTVILSQLL